MRPQGKREWLTFEPPQGFSREAFGEI